MQAHLRAASIVLTVAAGWGLSSRCTRAVEALRPIQPFSEIVGVAPGITASDLLKARPGVEPAAYAGYEESVAGYQIVYHFAGASYFTQESQRPRSGAKLVEIWAAKPLKSNELVTDVWNAQVAHVSGSVEPRPICFSIPPVRSRDLPGFLAIWSRSRDELRIAAVGEPLTPGSGRLVLRWKAKPRRLWPRSFDYPDAWIKIHCPE